MAGDSPVISQASATDLLSPYLKNLAVWKTLSDAIDTVFKQNIEQPIAQMENIRFITQDSEQYVLAETCRLLGFDLSQDVLNLSVDSFTRIATQLPMYSDYNGTEQFSKFLSLILGAYCDIVYLFTDDYEDFYANAQGTLITEGGVWFKSTHVELDVGMSSIVNLQLAPGQTLYTRVKAIFYQQAPVTLVIERMNFVVNDSATIGVSATQVNGYKVAFID